jgi:uncharacterized phosphosugar-binding protein
MSEATDHYLDSLTAGLSALRTDLPSVTAAANRLAERIAGEGIVRVFGSGHSAMLAQEVFHRAGGLVPFNAMLDVNLTIFGSAHATKLERLEGYAPAVFTNHDVQAGDAVIVISTSGINPVPIEVAEIARSLDALVIAVTAAGSYRAADSRHSSGRTLADVSDLVLDTRVPVGDAVVPVGTEGIRTGALSTVLGATLLNLLVVETARLLEQRGHPVPAFVSQNMPGGDDHNASLTHQYAHRLPLMKP